MNKLEAEIAVSQEQFIRWKQDPVTREVVRLLKEHLEALKNDMISGRCVDYSNTETTAQMVSRTVGVAFGINLFLEMSFDDA